MHFLRTFLNLNLKLSSVSWAPFVTLCELGSGLVGRFAAQSASSACLPCPAGQFARNSSSTSCLPCPSGQYQDEAGRCGCTLCPEWSVSARDSGSVTCTTCSPGWYKRSNDASSCSICQAGRYSDATIKNCGLCKPGRFSSVPGSPSCTGACQHSCFADSGTSMVLLCARAIAVVVLLVLLFSCSL